MEELFLERCHQIMNLRKKTCLEWVVIRNHKQLDHFLVEMPQLKPRREVFLEENKQKIHQKLSLHLVVVLWRELKIREYLFLEVLQRQLQA